MNRTRGPAWVLAGVLLLPISALAQDCIVRGMVYGAADVQQVDAQLAAPAFCQFSIERFERRLVLRSAQWRVEVPIPADLQGWVRFSYIWGSWIAYFGSRGVQVESGPVTQW